MIFMKQSNNFNIMLSSLYNVLTHVLRYKSVKNIKALNKRIRISEMKSAELYPR